ncbi:MAG: efflux RND transporter permease subunit, partial [Gemmatimonadetes bacterium]|nr:efflux RND transporter permease subunit [Gemmatimonadota bacterium]
MIERILVWALGNRVLVLVFSILLSGAGIVALRNLPIDAVPDVTNVQVQVLTTAPALGPEEVERFITTPVEIAMSGLPGLDEVRSVSKFGLSAVTVVFAEGTDIYHARQLVNERVQTAREAIPEGYGDPEMGPISTGLGEIFQFEVRGEGKSAMELRSILEWEIAPRLRRVPGVVEVNSFGGELKTYEVQVAPERLTQYGIALGDLFEAVRSSNANAGGAYIERSGEQYLVRGEGLLTSLEDIGNVVVS